MSEMAWFRKPSDFVRTNRVPIPSRILPVCPSLGHNHTIRRLESGPLLPRGLLLLLLPLLTVLFLFFLLRRQRFRWLMLWWRFRFSGRRLRLRAVARARGHGPWGRLVPIRLRTIWLRTIGVGTAIRRCHRWLIHPGPVVRSWLNRLSRRWPIRPRSRVRLTVLLVWTIIR